VELKTPEYDPFSGSFEVNEILENVPDEEEISSL
jgi:hypothetical protein